jgi:Zn-dependent peptidase ImmA (M78 family)
VPALRFGETYTAIVQNSAALPVVARRVGARHSHRDKYRRAPVSVERIAEYVGAQLRFAPRGDDGIAGMSHSAGGQLIIGVNAAHPLRRKRFTIAHEIGHIVLQGRSTIPISTIASLLPFCATTKRRPAMKRSAMRTVSPQRFLCRHISLRKMWQRS